MSPNVCLGCPRSIHARACPWLSYFAPSALPVGLREISGRLRNSPQHRPQITAKPSRHNVVRVVHSRKPGDICDGKRVSILGGGFAGVVAAERLADHSATNIRSPSFPGVAISSFIRRL